MSKRHNPAETCRANGWTEGTYLAGDEGYGETVIKITAIGERSILARPVSHKGQPDRGGEGSWTLEYRDWREVPPPTALTTTPTPPATGDTDGRLG